MRKLKSFQLFVFFHYVSSPPGSVRVVGALDREVTPHLSFTVTVADRGTPRLRSPTVAVVNVTVSDVNDVPPCFAKMKYEATLHTPTHKWVFFGK